MQQPSIPANESERLQAVRSLNVLDTPFEERFDRITQAAAKALHAPICTISIVDENREWFKSCVGTPTREGERSVSFCGHTIVSGKMLVIKDTTLDPRFADNPQVTNPPYVRFYAGITLFDRKSHLPIGAFCIKDTKPREMEMDELHELMKFAAEAEQELNLGVPISAKAYETGAGPE